MPTNSLKIGLIGAGRIGLLHAEHLTSRIPEADLVMVADVSEEAARECAERYDIPYFAQDYHAVLEHLDIQAVLICTSTDTHARIIEEAAQAGNCTRSRVNRSGVGRRGSCWRQSTNRLQSAL